MFALVHTRMKGILFRGKKVKRIWWQANEARMTETEFLLCSLQSTPRYVGHPISLTMVSYLRNCYKKSILYYPLHVAMGVFYLCSKYGVFITTWSEAIQICIQHCVSPWPRKSRFKQISIWR